MNLSSTPLAHRTILTVPHAENPFQDVRRISARWLTGKFGTAPFTSGHHHLDEVSVLTNQAAYLADGAEHAIRLQLREDKPEATWRTTITAVAFADSSALLSVGLEVFPNVDTPLTPGRPGLVRDLVRDLKPIDGPAPLTLDAQSVSAEQVDTLIDVLCDPTRRMPVIVAARPLRANPLWSQRLGKAMPRCAGAASLYLLADTEAVDAFRDAIGEYHRVAPGAVRTFLTDVDPAWPKDASRHRFLTMARMSDPQDRAWYGLARTVERLSTEAPLPEALRTLSFPNDAGQRHREERQAALAAVRPSDELAVMRKDVEELKALLAQADEELKEAALTSELSSRTVASMEEQLHIAVERADGDMEEALRALDDVERARAEGDVLRRRLRDAGRYEDTVVVEQPAGMPDSFEELWERLGTFEGILITADKSRALELDEAERARVWAAKAWNALRALDSYVQAARDGFNGGFYQYCTSGRPGAVNWPLKQLATAESETTMNKWGAERIFAVPQEVDSSGRKEMQAHLKLDSKGSTSPRVYFVDDTKGVTGQMIVGYIGPHLTNTKTN
ncbi:hypothetical protein B0675_10510 [Streptomyces sp. M41(2017)]|uniref:hypothetical protein n=1 Tax=Streptomyces sp. M41(2017) TaxID=1955065 RepID=UPI0009C12150|nr:hypothetical protein [Streptomyces sp. M41(2017)]OQQ17489.1 hypothetical protein B0675_10510 [Streptomyces sp. M41(2017)]